MLGIGKTNIGKKRKKNEDSILVKNDGYGLLPNLYIVADGMGGHKAGNVASDSAIKYFCQFVEENKNSEILDTLVEGVIYANEKVYDMSCENIDYYNMGTTFIAAVVDKGHTYIAHVGDSRLYKITNEVIQQITSDHSYVEELIKAGKITHEEARNHPQKNAITRAVGTDDEVVVDGLITPVKSGDIILMCTDGLCNMLKDEEIADVAGNSNLSVEQRIDCLIEMANDRGGLDNISIIIISVEGV